MLDIFQIPAWSIAIIPVAIIFLWLLFRSRQRHKNQTTTLSSEYFKGLNYLLNDEHDKALGIFVKLVESNWDTIDMHFTLGKIYRKNGEMDKAIKIHQGLIARPSLPERYKSKILLELGYDYLGAGWFDRAEGLFKEVLIQDSKSQEARHNLILIYQQEKDWHKAIDTAVDLFSENPTVIGPMIAHYHCELAVIAKSKGDLNLIDTNANKAMRYDANCVRASILLAELAKAKGDDKKALSIYESIEKQDPESMVLVIDAIMRCYSDLAIHNKFYEYLIALQERHENLFLQDVIADVLENAEGKQAAIKYLSARIKKQPSLSGMQLLANYKKSEIEADSVFSDMAKALTQLTKDSVEFRCQSCGFSSNTHYWLCPSCNRWERIKPSVIEHEQGA